MSDPPSHPSATTRPIEVVCAILEDDDERIFVARRPPGKHLGGMWEFPGGKIEAGETEEEALARELREELGITVSVGKKLSPALHTYEQFTIRLHPFLAKVVEGIPTPHEHDLLQWVSRSDLRNLSWAPADLPIVDQVLSLGPND